MALVNQPPILASSFAVNGDKNIIPTTNSGTEGLASLSLGFPPITQQPVSQGGIPPQRADFNGIFNLITNFLMFIQNGSIFAYSSSLDYQPPAIVYGNNALYRCIATNGANTSAGVQPLSNTSYWQPLIPVGGITVSGNTITVTNETGTQIQYTIDTITNPPSQSDTSNKIVTSAWVKAYAPSKSGSGASGTWGINISGNASTATEATSATSATEAGNINKGYINKGFPSSNFREVVLDRNNTGFCVRPFSSQFADGSYPNSSGVGFGAGDTHGYLQVNYNDAVAFIGGGNENKINWYKKIAFTESPAFTGTPTAPTPSTSDNSTKIATTAFVKSLFTASKQQNGWWKDGNTGIIWQWCTPSKSTHNNSFPISFPNKVLHVFATNTNVQGVYVDNAFAYPINNSTYYYATKPSNNSGIGLFDGAVFAIGY